VIISREQNITSSLVGEVVRTRIGITFSTLLLLYFYVTPLYAQNFDTLLNELSGSDADQLESEAREPGKEPDQPPPQPSSTDITSPPEEDEFAPQKNIVTNGVTLQGLDKQTARVFIIDAAIGKVVEFGTLKITVHHCEKTPLDDRQESIAFVSITEEKTKNKPHQLYSGWMFASSPALSALDHPVYDVWIKGCKQMK